MNNVSYYLKSVTNRLIIVTVMAYFIVDAIFANMASGFELYFWRNSEFHIWQFVSYVFLHGSITHLAFNMIGLWSFGNVLEKAWGGKRMLVFYLICGIGAALIHLAYSEFILQSVIADLQQVGFSEQQISSVYLYGRDISAQTDLITRESVEKLYRAYNATAVGASGSLYGILVAFAMLFPNFKIMLIFLPIPIAAKYFVPVLLLVDLTAGITGVSIFGYNIAHFAHLGGALTGLLLLSVWLSKEPNK